MDQLANTKCKEIKKLPSYKSLHGLHKMKPLSARPLPLGALLQPEVCRLPGNLVLVLLVPVRGPVQRLPDSDETLVMVTGSQDSYSL